MQHADRELAFLAIVDALITADPAPVVILTGDGTAELANAAMEASPHRAAVLGWLAGSEGSAQVTRAMTAPLSVPFRVMAEDATPVEGRLRRLDVPGIGARCHLRLETQAAVTPDLEEAIARNRHLQEACQKAQDAELAQGRFVSVLSHEMRTPLNGLIATVDLMRREGEMSARQMHLLRIVEQSALSALDQMNTALAFARSGDSAYRVAPRDFLPAEILRDVADQQGPVAQRKGLNLKVAFSGDPALRLYGAAPHLFTILQNLLSNAVKFTEGGEVRLSMHVHAPENDVAALELSVEDTGPGIAPDRAEAIFEAFETGAAHHDIVGGAGLGLTIARRSVQALDGQIVLKSTPGRGTRFDVACAFPVGLPPVAQAEELPPPSPIEGKRVLVADDNDINREVLAALLTARGLRVTLAENGMAAVEAVRSPCTEGFDLVIMDLGLPDIDGAEAARRIHVLPGQAGLPIVGVTAWLDAAIESRCLLAGMAQVLEKPVRDNDILRIFQQINGFDTQPLRHRAIEDLALSLGRIAQDIRAGEIPRAVDTTHKTRGFVSALGFTLLARELHDLEGVLRHGASDALPRLARIRASLAEMNAPDLGKAQTPWAAMTG